MEMKKRKLTLYHSGPVLFHILVNESILMFGNDPRQLKPNSCKFVITKCQVCNNERAKKYREARQNKLCIKCSNNINSSSLLSKKLRSEKMKNFYLNGGKHPTKDVGHTEETKKLMSIVKIGKKLNLTLENKEKLKIRCNLILNNPEQKAKTILINKKRIGKLSWAYGRTPPHGTKVWYETIDNKKICFRSTWEAKFANWLDNNKIIWSYESKTFPIILPTGNDGTYTPDFVSGNKYYEVKGRWVKSGLEKVCAFVTQYPWLELIIIDREKMKELSLI